MRIRNYGWCRVALANNLSLEQLEQLKQQVEAEHENERRADGFYYENGMQTIHRHNKVGRKKLDDLSWAVYNKMKRERKEQTA